MKAFFILCLLAIPVLSFSQTLKLEVSNPEPRVGDYITLTINADSLSKDVFSSISDKDFTFGYEQYLSTDLKATSAGKKTIGPFSITLNGKKYITNKLDIRVAESLPDVPQGLWIRKVNVTDSIFYILIEQRKLVSKNVAAHKDNSINTTMTSNSDTGETELINISISNVNAAGISATSSISQTEGMPESVYYFHIYKFNIADKSKHIILTKENFKGLPDYYKFQDIVVN